MMSRKGSWTDIKQNFAQVLLMLQAKTPTALNNFPHVTEDQIVLQSKYICRDYIYAKLKSLKLVKNEKHIDGSRPRPKPSDISQELIKVAQAYEMMYPNLFTDVCSYLKMNFEHEEQVQSVFNVIASEIIGRGTSWARIVSLFTFTANLAVDCVQQENTRFANLVVDSMQKFTKKRLAAWILQQGGWLGMVYYLHNNHHAEPQMRKVRNLASAVGFVTVMVFAILDNMATALISGDDEILT